MVKKILKMKNQIASVQELRVKDKNDVVTRRLNIFVELCIRLYCKEHDTQCNVQHVLCDRPSKDFYGTLCIRLFLKLIPLQELLLSLWVRVRNKCK